MTKTYFFIKIIKRNIWANSIINSKPYV